MKKEIAPIDQSRNTKSVHPVSMRKKKQSKNWVRVQSSGPTSHMTWKSQHRHLMVRRGTQVVAARDGIYLKMVWYRPITSFSTGNPFTFRVCYPIFKGRFMHPQQIDQSASS
eukprot:Lithocolla_globosa_v1_NODE_966_length_3014_cov_12.896249.p3 type:complete len:112 gc:universal NODE_966_length_3014_cov_12.896249:446-111(-)